MRTTSSVPRLLVTLLGCVLMLALATNAGGASTSAATEAGVLRFATFKPPQTLDPAKYTGGAAGLVFHYPVYDALLRLDPRGNITPGLATSWKLRADGVLLTLRRGVRFSDGAAFNALAVKQNLRRCIAIGGGCGTTAIQWIKVINPFTVLLKTRAPSPALLFQLATAPGMMVSPRAFGSDDLGVHPVGAGPYVLDTDATVPGSKYVYTKNRRYWNPKEQTLSRIEISVIGSAQQRVNAMRTGQIDASMVGDAQELAAYRQAGIDTRLSAEGDMFAILVLDPSGPLADRRVRQALGYAVNRGALTESPARKDLAKVADQLFPKGRLGHVASPSFSFSYDLAKAKSLLAQAGVKDVSFTIPAQPGPQNLTETQAVAGMLNAAGFDAKVFQPPPQLVTKVIYSGDYPVAYTPIWEPDAALLADAISPEHGYMNPKHIKDPVVARLAEQAARAMVTNPAKGKELYGKLAQRLVEQAMIIPVFSGPAGVAYVKNVKNLKAWSYHYMGPPFRGVTVGG